MSIFKARQKLSLTLTPLLTLIVFAFAAPSASAAIVHEYLPTPTKEISTQAPSCTGPGSVTGALGDVNAMTVDEGHLWLAESLAEGTKERVDELNASTGVCEQQLEASASLERVDRSVAVGHKTGPREVYVGAYEKHVNSGGLSRVAVFEPSGALQATWTGADTPSGSFNSELFVATDESGLMGDWASGDVLVGDELHQVVDVIAPGAGGGEPPSAHVREITGTCTEPDEVVGSLGCVEVPLVDPRQVAVDQVTGEVFVVEQTRVVDVFRLTGMAGEVEYVGQLSGFEHNVTSLAVDGGAAAGGDVYVTEEGVGGHSVIDEFAVAGQRPLLDRLTGTPSGPFLTVNSLAVNPENGYLYVGDNRAELGEPGVVDVFGPDLVVPDVITEPASGETPRSATLNGKLNPEGLAVEACEFEYGTTTAYAHTVACTQNEAEIGSSVGEVPVSAPVAGLLPDTTYHFRLRAGNEHDPGEPSSGGDQTFTTGGPGILSTSASKVAATSATLDATLEPHNVPTSYRFEYDTKPYRPEEAAHGTAVPATAEAIGSTPGPVPVAQHIQGLAAGTTYYYRVVTVGEIEGREEEFDGEGHAFTTQGAGEFALPDHRQYEMVSPPDKDGALLDGIGQGSGQGAVIQAAADGDALTYVATAPTEPEPAGDALETQVLSTRVGGGGGAGASSSWSTHDLTLPHAASTGSNVGLGLEVSLLQRRSQKRDRAAVGSVRPMYLSSGSTTAMPLADGL